MSNAERCTICHKPIKTMAYKGTGVCGENHRKDRDDDWTPTGMKKRKGPRK